MAKRRKEERKSKKEFAEYVESACRTIISKPKTRLMPLEEGMKIAMEHTKETGEEAGFCYNPKTRLITSRIIAGNHQCVFKPLEELYTKAFFHTHPKLYEDKQCELSIGDLFQMIPNNHNVTELKVGCPTNNEIVTLNFNPNTLTRLLIELTRIETEQTECLPIMEGALTSICDELAQIFPELEEKIEVIRKKYLFNKEELPSLLRESIMTDLEYLEAQLIAHIPKKREKLTI